MEIKQAFNEGDVFRFAYSDAERERRGRDGRDPNWCFDGQVIVRNGRLCDTYWSESIDPRTVTPEEGALTFVCNLAEVVDIQSYEVIHYDEADVMDLTSHRGHRQRFVVRKGTQTSVKRMLAEVTKKEHALIAEMESSVRLCGHTLAQLGGLRARLETGDASLRPWW